MYMYLNIFLFLVSLVLFSYLFKSLGVMNLSKGLYLFFNKVDVLLMSKLEYLSFLMFEFDDEFLSCFLGFWLLDREDVWSLGLSYCKMDFFNFFFLGLLFFS